MLEKELYNDDPCLMLRDVALCCQKGENIPNITSEAIKKNYKLIRYVPKRQIKTELDRLIMTTGVVRGFQFLYECGILKIILPCLERCFHEPQKNKFHIYNVGEHILHTVENCPFCLETRWAALMHDVGKPECVSRDAAGVIHFYGHHSESVRIAKDLFYKLGFSEEDRNLICTLIEYHDVHFDQTVLGVKRALSKLGEEKFLMLMDLQEADAQAKSPLYIREKCAAIDNLRKICAEIIAKGEPYRYSDLAIGKRDLIKLKYRAERQMRDVLWALLEEVIQNPALNKREYLLKRASILKNRR